jgi:lysophospholipase L1-like esterase
MGNHVTTPLLRLSAARMATRSASPIAVALASSALLSAALFSAAALTAVAAETATEAPAEGTIVWHDLADFALEGQGWPVDDLAARYDRLPAKAEGIVRDAVWSLSRHSAGLHFRFVTDATEIHLHHRVGGERIAMAHMPATAVSGIDLYALAPDGAWRWVEVTRPSERETKHKVEGLDPGRRTYALYLPLYNSTESVLIGVPEGAEFLPVAPRADKPVVFYGTSITHGASASRPGMVHTAILGRRLDLPVVNLGFSGNGRMESEVGALLTEIDAAVYVIDCLPNMDGDAVAERTEPLVRQIRAARPDTPIVLVEDRSFTNAWVFRARRERHEGNRAALIRAYDRLVSSGVTDLYYIPGEDLLGDDSDGAVDGSHPNDLGFLRQAEAFEPVLREALGLD